MNRILQFFILLCSLIMFIFVIVTTRKNKMLNKYSVLWIAWALLLIVISIFPQIIYYLSELMGFEKPVNAIFLIALFILYCLSFNIYLKISKMNEEITKLNYVISSLRKELEDKN